MAESPSELQAEVEKLERKHAENPEGRYFVPLANDYRKMGELERAEALLRAGLDKHPDYLSAHIVLGRCLTDRGATSEAADEFTYVLSMDPQNLIALRSLGELAAAEGRRDDAGRWYRELLAVDPMNEDARRALEQLDAPEESAPEPEPAEPGGWWDGAEDGAEPAAAAIDTGGSGNDRDDVVEAATDEGSRTASFGEAAPEDDPYGALLDIGTAGESEAPGPEGDQQPEYGMMELSPSGGADGNVEGYEGGYEDPDADEIEPVEVVTETIAELYARQGLHDRAADVYRELIRRRGGDASLERRLEELERTAAGSERPAEDPFAASFAEGFADDPTSAPDEPWTAATDEKPEQGAGAGEWGADPEAPAEREDAPPAWRTASEEPAEQPSSGDRASPAPAEPWAAAAEAPAEQEPADQRAPGDEPPPDEPPGYEAPGDEVTGYEVPGYQAPGDEAPGDGAPVDEPAAGREAAPAPARSEMEAAGRTIGGYLSSLATWAPAAEPEPEAVELGVEDVTEIEASPAAETYVGGEDAADPFPWEVPGDEATRAASGGEPAEEPTRATSPEPEPVAEPGPTPGAGSRTSPEPEPPAGEELPGASDAEPEPSIELADYFPADDADAGAEPAEPASPPPAVTGGAPAGQEDDDLESFQAWLRSLKR